jgi:hypothetical protein
MFKIKINIFNVDGWQSGSSGRAPASKCEVLSSNTSIANVYIYIYICIYIIDIHIYICMKISCCIIKWNFKITFNLTRTTFIRLSNSISTVVRHVESTHDIMGWRWHFTSAAPPKTHKHSLIMRKMSEKTQ